MQNLLSNVLSLTPLKRLIATTIQSQLSRFIEGIELDSLGLLGGDLVLENLELRKDVVQELLGIPMAFDLDRGFIKELRIHIPWTRLTSKPIEIKFHTVEIVVVPTKGDAASARKSEARAGSHDEHSSDDTHSDPGDADVDAAAAAVASEAASAPSWTQTLITRALANISLTVENLVLKLDDGEVVLSATLPSFRVHSADPDLGWECRWLNLFGPYQLVHKLVEAKQLTVCLDRYTPGNTPSNKRARSIVGYERPLLDRVSLTVRLQIPLERRPAFERLEREQLGNRILSEGTQADQDSLAAYGSGDISSGYFDDAYGWAGVDGRSFADGAGSAEKTSTPKLAPVFKLPCASNCGRALAGEVRRPWVRKDDQDPVYTQDGPFDDRDELWVPMPGWSRPDLTLVDPLAEKYSTDDASANTTSAATQVLPSEMPMPNLVADVHCAALNFSFSERQISMLHSLVSLTSGPKEHSALNAHHSPKPLKRNTKAVPRNSPRNHAESDPSQAKAALPEVLQAAPELDPPLQSRSWLSRIFFKDNVNGEAMDNVISEAKHEVGLNSTGSKSTDVGVKKADHSLVIVSVSLPCVTVDLLRHSANADGDLGDSTPVEGSTHGTSEAGLTEEGDESDSSEESLNVPVFGLGVVKVDGLKSQQRKAESPHSQSRKREAGRSEVASHDNRLPKSFLRFELKGCIIDSHQLNGGGLSFLDTKLQICGASVSPTGALLKSLSSSMAMPPQLLEVGRADSSSLPTESFLSRSAEHLLTNYTLLRCDDSTLGEALHTSSSANMEVEPVKGAALEARFISVSNKLSQDSDIANEVNADQPNSNGEAPQSSDGLSMDIRVGVTEVNWSEKVVDHLHGFLTEAPFNSTGKLFEMTSSGSFESSKQKETRTSLVREPSHCVHYYYVDCAAITTTHFRDITSVRVEPDISGVFSAATAMQVKQPQLAYSMVEMSEECAKKYAQSASKLANGTTEDVCVRWSSFEVKHTDRFGFPGGSDSEFLPSRSVDHHLCSALDGMNGCIFRIDGLSLQSSITTAFLERLHCASVKVLVDSSFEAKASSINATLSLESIHALSEFLNAAQLLTKLGKAQALELHLGNQQQLNSASRHSCLQMAGALEMCTSDLAFQASAQGAREEKGIEHTAVFAVRGNLGLLSLKKSDSTSVNRFPIISTRHAAGSNLSRTSCPFISGNVKIENPSNKFLDSVRQLSGYQILSKRLTTQTNPPSDLAVPTLRCDASIGEAHFDVQNATLAFAALGAMSSSFFDAIAMQSSSSTKALKKNAHVAAPLDMTEFAVVPNIQTSAWLLWLSPHLLFKSPEVSVVKASASEQMHLDCFMTMTGSKLLGNTVPFYGGRDLHLPSSNHEIFFLSKCTTRAKIPLKLPLKEPRTYDGDRVVNEIVSISVNSSDVCIDLDATKVAILSAFLRSLEVNTKMRAQFSQMRKIDNVMTSLDDSAISNTTSSLSPEIKDQASISVIPAAGHRKRLDLCFDEVFRQVETFVPEKNTDPPPPTTKPSFQPIFFEASVSKFSLALKLRSSSASQVGGVDNRTSHTFRVAFHNIQSSFTEEFGGQCTGSDRWEMLSRMSHHAHASFLPASATSSESIDNNPSFNQVQTYRFVIGSLGACEEDWSKPHHQSPLGLLLLAIFTSEPSASDAIAYFTTLRSLNTLAPLITAYIGDPLTTSELAPRALSLALGLGVSRPHLLPKRTPSETAAHAPWPWLCTERSDSRQHLWFEAQVQRETALSNPESTSTEATELPHSKLVQRPKAHLKLRKSDVLLHLPTLAAIADLLHGLVPRVVPVAMTDIKTENAAPSKSAPLHATANAPAEGSECFLPYLTFEVQTLRMLVVYTRMQTNDWSAIAAFQWTLTVSAKSHDTTTKPGLSADSTHASNPMREHAEVNAEPFRIAGVVGPMDVATVSWKRRSRLRSGTALGDVSSPGSIVLQGPTASYFESLECYAMAQEVLFGDPFEFSVIAEEIPYGPDNVTTAAQLRLVVEASPAIFTCQPDQYAACLSLLVSVRDAARSVASTRAAHVARIQQLPRATEPILPEDTGKRSNRRSAAKSGDLKGAEAQASTSEEVEEGDGEVEDDEDSSYTYPTSLEPSQQYRGRRASSPNDLASYEQGDQNNPALKSATTLLPKQLCINYSFSAPEVKVTLFSPRPAPSTPMSTSMTHLSMFRPSSSSGENTTRSAHVIPLLDLRTSHVAIAGTSPGSSSITVDNCAIRCWPHASSSSATSSQGVALFGLAAESASNGRSRSTDNETGSCTSDHSSCATSPANEPLLRVDWTTESNGHLPNDVLAQLRPVFMFASPAVLAALMQFASQGIPSSTATRSSASTASSTDNESDAAVAAAAVAAEEEADAKYLTPLRYPLPLRMGTRYVAHDRNRHDSAATANSSFLGNVSVKFLSRQIQMVAATDAEGKQGAAAIFTISHVFLNKKKALPMNHGDFRAGTPASTPSATTAGAAFGDTSKLREHDKHGGCAESDSGSASTDSSTSSSGDEDTDENEGLNDGDFKERKTKRSCPASRGMPRPVAEDEIMLNALGCSLEFRTDYRRRRDPHVTDDDNANDVSNAKSNIYSHRSRHTTGNVLPFALARELDCVDADACFVPPCELSLALRGQILNELRPMALVDLAVECDELSVNLSAERFQVFFAVASALVNTLNLPPPSVPPPSLLTQSGSISPSNVPLQPRKRPHPALVPPPTPNATTHRVQLGVPLDVFADRRLGSLHRNYQARGRREMAQQFPPPLGVLLFGKNSSASSGSSADVHAQIDPRATAEANAAQHFWIAPQQPFLRKPHHQNPCLAHAGHKDGQSSSSSTNSSSGSGSSGGGSVHSAMPSVSEQHRAATLARSECLAVEEWFACAHWAYGTPRSVLRLEMKQLAIPKALLASRDAQYNKRSHRHHHSTLSSQESNNRNALAVVHLSFERRDPTTHMWVQSALLSVPLVAVDPPPVTHQQRHYSTSSKPEVFTQTGDRGLSQEDGIGMQRGTAFPGGGYDADANTGIGSATDPVWASWLEGGEYAAWCKDHSHRSSLKYLVPPNQPASEWRLLWACPDLTRRMSSETLGSREPADLKQALPQLFIPSLGIASVEDLPLLAFSWRARTMRVNFLSPAGQLLSNLDPEESANRTRRNSRSYSGHSTLMLENGNICRPPEALVQFDTSSFGASLSVASGTWASLVAPSLFVDGDLSVKVHDFATLTSACVASVPRASLWVRTLPRGATSYFATTAVTCSAGDSAHMRASPRLLKAFKVVGNELATMFQPPPTPSHNVHEGHDQNRQNGDSSDEGLVSIDPASDVNHVDSSLVTPGIPTSTNTSTNDSLRYMIENATNEPLWFGQQATAESLVVGSGKSCGYSWRELPNDPIWSRESSTSFGRSSTKAVEDYSRGAGLSLRFALTSNSTNRNHRRNDVISDNGESRRSCVPGAWSEPVRIDRSTLSSSTESVTQRVSVLRDHDAAASSGAISGGTVACALMVTVQKHGLQTVITLRGKFALRCTLPHSMEVRLCVLSMGAAAAVTAAAAAATASAGAVVASSSAALEGPAASQKDGTATASLHVHSSPEQDKDQDRERPQQVDILNRTPAASTASTIINSALATCGQAHSAVVSASTLVDTFVLLPDIDFQLDSAVVAAAESIARDASSTTATGTTEGSATAAAAAIRSKFAESPNSAVSSKANPLPTQAQNAQQRRASHALAGIGDGAPFLAVQSRPAAGNYEWSSPALLSLRTGAVLFDSFADTSTKDDDNESSGSNHDDGTSSINSSMDCSSSSSSSSTVGGSLDSGSVSHGIGPALNSSPRQRYPIAASGRKRSSPLAHALNATGSFSAASVQCAEVAVRSARARHRSLAAVFAPLTTTTDATTAATASSDGSAIVAKNSSGSGGVWAVVSTRPLQWGAIVSSPTSSSSSPEWTLLELTSPLVLHNDHSEPLLMAVRRREKDNGESLPEVDNDTANTDAVSASNLRVSEEPRPFGRPPAIRTNISSTSSSSNRRSNSSNSSGRSSRLPPSPDEPYTPPPSSPSLRAVDAARERLAAKMSQVAASQQEGQEDNDKSNTGSRRMSLNQSTRNSIKALNSADGVYVVQVPANGQVSLNVSPCFNYTATVLRETRLELSAIAAANAAASQYLNQSPSSHYGSISRPLIANLALPVRDVLLPCANSNNNNTNIGYSEGGISTSQLRQAPLLLPPYQLQVNSLLLGPVSAARGFSLSANRHLSPFASANVGGDTGSRPGSFSFAPSTRGKQPVAHVNAHGQSGSASDLSDPGLPPLPTSASSSISLPPSSQPPVSGLTPPPPPPPPPLACYMAAAETLTSTGIPTLNTPGALHCRLGPRALIRNRLDVAIWVEVSTRRATGHSSGRSDRSGESATPVVVCIPPHESRPLPVLPESHFDSRQRNRREQGHGNRTGRDNDDAVVPALRFGTAAAWRRSDGRVTLVQSAATAGSHSSGSSGEKVIVGWSRRFGLDLLDHRNGTNEEFQSDTEPTGEHYGDEYGEDGDGSDNGGGSGAKENNRVLQLGADASLVAVFHPADRDRDLVLPLLVKVLSPAMISSDVGDTNGHLSNQRDSESGSKEGRPNGSAMISSQPNALIARGLASFPAAHVHDPMASLHHNSGSSSKSTSNGASGNIGSSNRLEGTQVPGSILGATGGVPAVIDVNARLSIVSPPVGAHGLRLDLLLAEDSDSSGTGGGGVGGLQGGSKVGQRPLWMEVPPLEKAPPPTPSAPAGTRAEESARGELLGTSGAQWIAPSWSRCLLGVAAVDADVETASEAGIDDSVDGSMHSSRSNNSGNSSGKSSKNNANNGHKDTPSGRLSWLFGGWRCASSEQKDRGKRERARRSQEQAFGAAADFRYGVSFLGSQTIPVSVGRIYGANSMHDNDDDNNAINRPVFAFHPTPAAPLPPSQGVTQSNSTSNSAAGGARAERDTGNSAAVNVGPDGARNLKSSVGGAPSTGVAVTAAHMVVPWRSQPLADVHASTSSPPTSSIAPGVEHRLMSVASHASPLSGAVHVLIAPVLQPPLVVKNVGRWGAIEFHIDEDEPFGAPLLPCGGSAEYDWRHHELTSAQGRNGAQEMANANGRATSGAKTKNTGSLSNSGDSDGRKSSSSNDDNERGGSDLLHPKPKPSHMIRLRLARTNAYNPVAAAAASTSEVGSIRSRDSDKGLGSTRIPWSEALRIAEGVQMVTLLSSAEEQVVATVHVYHRAGTLVALIWCESDNYSGNNSFSSCAGSSSSDHKEAISGSSDGIQSPSPHYSVGWEALKRYTSGRPCHLDVSFAAMGRFTMHLVDDAAPAVLRPSPLLPPLPSPLSSSPTSASNSRSGPTDTPAAASAAAATAAAEDWALQQAIANSLPASQPALVYREIAQIHSTNLSVRMVESPPEPRRLVTSTATTSGSATTNNIQDGGGGMSSLISSLASSSSSQDLSTAGAPTVLATAGARSGVLVDPNNVDLPGPQFHFLEETSHVKYMTRFTCRAQDVQVDSSLPQSEFPVVLWCEPSSDHASKSAAAAAASSASKNNSSSSSHDSASADASTSSAATQKKKLERRLKRRMKSARQQIANDSVPCLDVTVEMVSVHQPSVPTSSLPLSPIATMETSSSQWRAPLLPCDTHLGPYTSLVKVNMPRKVVVALEDPFLSAMAEAASQFLEASVSTNGSTSRSGSCNNSSHSSSGSTGSSSTSNRKLNGTAVSGGAESNSITASNRAEQGVKDHEDQEKAAVLAWVVAKNTTLVYVGRAEISDLEASATLRMVMPGSTVFLGLDQTPLYFRKLVLKRALASASRLANEVSTSYAADALLRSPQLVGSLQLLGAPTSLWRAVTTGLRDLVALPLEAVPHGPVAVLRGALKGTSSFARHVSGGALSSVSGFASSASRNLQTLQEPSSVHHYHRSQQHHQQQQQQIRQRNRLHESYSLSSSSSSAAAADGDSDDHGDDSQYTDNYGDNYGDNYSENHGDNYGNGQAGEDFNLEHPRTVPLSEEDGEVEGDDRSLARRVLEGVGRGLVVAPLVGAMQIVGRGTAALSQTVAGGGARGITEASTAASPRLPLPLARLPGGTPMVCSRALGLWQRTALLGARDPTPLLFAAPVAAAQPPMSGAAAVGATSAAAAATAAGPTSAAAAAAAAATSVYDPTTGNLSWVPATLLLTQANLHLHAIGRGNALWLSLPLHQIPLESVQHQRRSRSGNHRTTPFLVLSEPPDERELGTATADASSSSVHPPSSTSRAVARQVVVVIGLSPSHHAMLVEAIVAAQNRHERRAFATSAPGATPRTEKYSV